MSLQDKIRRFAEERRAMIEELLAQQNKADTAKVTWQGFNNDGYPLVKKRDKTEAVDGQGYVSNQKNKSMIYDDAGSVEYFKKKKSKLSRYQKNQPEAKASVTAKKKTSNLVVPDAGSYAIAIVTPVEADVTCIAVIDENNNANTDSAWAAFRQTYPQRKFFLLEPLTGYQDTLYVPPAFSTDVNALWRTVDVDPAVDDWYEIANLQYKPYGSQVILFIDQSGSMTIADVEDSYLLFKQKCIARENKVAVVDNTSEDYIAPFYIADDYFNVPGYQSNWPQ